jgi:hypothetical protein
MRLCRRGVDYTVDYRIDSCCLIRTNREHLDGRWFPSMRLGTRIGLCPALYGNRSNSRDIFAEIGRRLPSLTLDHRRRCDGRAQIVNLNRRFFGLPRHRIPYVAKLIRPHLGCLSTISPQLSSPRRSGPSISCPLRAHSLRGERAAFSNDTSLYLEPPNG